MTQTQKDMFIQNAKYNWLCNGIELLNLQKVEWYPFEHGEFVYPVDIFSLEGHNEKIYIETPDGDEIESSVKVLKGSAKEISHRNSQGEIITQELGSHNLRIHAFIIMHFKKFSGDILFRSKGSVITGIEFISSTQ